MDRSLSGLKFRSRIIVRPDLVADRHGTIASCLAPIPLSAGLKRNGAIDIAQARNATGWILTILRGIVIFIALLVVNSVLVVRWGVLSSNGGGAKSDSSCQQQRVKPSVSPNPFNIHKPDPLTIGPASLFDEVAPMEDKPPSSSIKHRSGN